MHFFFNLVSLEYQHEFKNNQVFFTRLYFECAFVLISELERNTKAALLYRFSIQKLRTARQYTYYALRFFVWILIMSRQV